MFEDIMFLCLFLVEVDIQFEMLQDVGTKYFSFKFHLHYLKFFFSFFFLKKILILCIYFVCKFKIGHMKLRFFVELELQMICLIQIIWNIMHQIFK